jgi:hypothetical protein
MKSRLYTTLLVGVLALGLTVARADDTTNTVKFSDPSKPGTLRINLGRGELRVQGADTSDVSVKSNAKIATSKPRADGLRVISAASSFSLKESNNVVTLDGTAPDAGRGNSDFTVTVPRNTTVVVQNAWGGEISCTGLSGDIEINNMHGGIRLDDVTGGVVVSTMNGEIRANIRELHEGKALSFTAMNGEVALRVPETAKATVRLRTQNGSVLTDFDESALVTKTESAAGFPRGKMTFSNRKVLTQDIQDAIRDATQLSATAIREALEAVKEGFEASRLDSDDARRQVEDARREIERTRRDAERSRSAAERERRAAASRAERSGEAKDQTTTPPPASPAVPSTPLPPMPKISMATMSGGKLVTGTLNGGGPEISVATMNGDVILRKLEPKK